MEEVVSDQPPDLTPSPDLENSNVGLPSTPVVTKPSVPIVDEDGFTIVTRKKKMGPIKVQGRKQKPVKVKVVSQQYEHGQPSGRKAPTGPKGKQSGKDLHSNQVAYNPGVLKPPTMVSNATKKVSTRFNFTRVVQGDKGGKKQQPLCAKSANPSKSIDINTANRFSVLDIPKSIKFNKLIGVQDDLYPPDHSLLDGMDVDMIRPMVGQNGDCQSSQKQVGDYLMGNENGVCHLNREHIEGVRVLPASVLSNPRLGGNPTTSSSLHGPGKSGKTYGISDEQKRAIADRLKTTGSISMDIIDQWYPGQWDFFNDHCTLMGLDPDYCIEDVDSDTENGTSQFLSGLLNSGAPKPPPPPP
ncbi:hypothetical protein L1987_14069 [Smallanthus sonchifolius]|uniref:Uncharacterized protein n=1 Tax=Smallanthus sonchifolius TaxID=185202 RepID=A0ACB9J2K2_9ASTR|nr:hypothetical protein L1987_14069 [Smallanthus sonchifolius]